MPRSTKKIAVLADNPALNALLSQTLEGEAGIAVYTFASLPALVTMLRLAPMDLLLLDADSLGDAGATVAALRDLPGLASRAFQVALLTRAAEPFHGALLEHGVDAVLRKPVSPAALVSRINAQLWPSPQMFSADGIYRGPERRAHAPMRLPQTIVRHDNVVPLFPR